MGSPTADQQDALAAGTATVSGSHSIGVADGGPGLAVTGWSTTGGDLRIGHFLGLHAAQGLPLLALLLGVLAAWRTMFCNERVRLGLVVVAAGTWLGGTLLLSWRALRGQPLLEPDGLTLAGLAVLVVGSAVGVAAVLRAGRRRARSQMTGDAQPA